MPIYMYACTVCEETFEAIKRYEEKTIHCVKCKSGEAVRQQSYRFHAHGLPNGFSTTRSKSKGE